MANSKKEKLYYLRDNTIAMGDQVYSGHYGTGKKFSIYMSDYGKYAMRPITKKECESLIKTIEKAYQGTRKTLLQKDYFSWEIIPMSEISLCNFYEDTPWNQEAFNKLKEEQLKLK